MCPIKRERRKAAELHTSGAKRAKPWRAGVKRGEPAISLAVASGDVRHASFGGRGIVGSEIYECRRTHTLSEYPLGKYSEAKLLKELIVLNKY